MKNGITVDLLAFSMNDIKNIGRLLAHGIDPALLNRPNEVLEVLVNGTEQSGKSALIDYLANTILPKASFISGFETSRSGEFATQTDFSDGDTWLKVISYENRSFGDATSRSINLGLLLIQNDFPENMNNLGILATIRSPFIPEDMRSDILGLKRLKEKHAKRIGHSLDQIRKTRDFKGRSALKQAFDKAGGFDKDAQWPRLVSISIRDDIAAYPAMQNVIDALKSAPTTPRSGRYFSNQVNALPTKRRHI